MRCRLLLWIALGLLGAALLVPVAAVAQDSVDADSAVLGSEFDTRMTEGTIERVSNTLLIIAASTGFMLVLYIGHTSPRRRVRVANRRRNRREATVSL